MRLTREGLTLLATLACIGVAVAQDQQAASGCGVVERTDSQAPEEAPQSSQFGREPIKVPMEFVMGLPTIEVTINGQGPF